VPGGVERVGVLHGSILRADGNRGSKQDEGENTGGKHQHLFFDHGQGLIVLRRHIAKWRQYPPRWKTPRGGDEFFIACREPAPDASRFGRDLARILLCDATTVVVMFSSLVAHVVRSF